jgi:hypothetical protein
MQNATTKYTSQLRQGWRTLINVYADNQGELETLLAVSRIYHH